MLGRVDLQGSLLQTRLVRRHLVTKGSFYERLADHGHEIVSDQDFAHLYAGRRGRPSIPPSVMVKALLLATHDRTSDRETSRRTRVDADWKAAMGVDDDFTGVGATTFSLFRSRLVVNDADHDLFTKTLDKAISAGVLKGKRTAIIDSSPVHGAGAVADTYELLRRFLGQVVRAGGGRLSAEARRGAEPHVGDKPDIDWSDPSARHAYLGQLVAAIRAVVKEAGDIDDPALSEPVALLAQVVDQDVEEDKEGEPEIKQGVARDRVVSHSDPEMRHGRKSASRRFDGHKMDLVTDEETELVLGVGVRAGNASDGEAAAPLLGQVQEEGVQVETLLADMAYSDGDVRQAVEDQGATLVAKVPPLFNSGRFPKTDFHIDTDAFEVTCPAGEVTSEARPATDHKGRQALRFVFAAGACAACPLRSECVAGAGGRTILVGVHEDHITAARMAQSDPGVRDLLRRRSKVERKIDHLQDLGMRKARYRGRRKTLLQGLLAATVANFSRLAVLAVFDVAPALAPAA